MWFQLKMKQAFHHLYLNMMGNVQAGFRSTEALREAEQRKGGSHNLASTDIFDCEKYLEKMRREMSDYKFMETFVER